MVNKFKSSFLIFLFLQLFLPILAFADNIRTIMDTVLGILDTLVVPTLIVLATVVFIWGIIQYVLAGGSDTRKKEAKNLIIWGLIGLFVIVAMWGIVKIFGDTIGIQPGTSNIPEGPRLR